MVRHNRGIDDAGCFSDLEIYRARGSGSIQQGDVVPLSFSGAGGWSDESAAECIEACDCPEFQKLLRSHEAKAGKKKTADMLKSMVTGYGTKAIKKQLLKGEATKKPLMKGLVEPTTAASKK